MGRNKLSEELRKYYLINYQEGYRFGGYFDHESNPQLINSLAEYCKENEVHEIFYCVDNPSPTQLQQLVSFGLDSLIKVKLIAGETIQNQAIQFDKYDQIPAFDLATLPLDEYRNQVIKRIFDLLFSIIFLIAIFSWLYPLIAILIKLDSKGPVFFIQLRNGLKNHPFWLL
ncbi:MAG: sugar transferase [Flammeovirgaceae bacterium]|nr:sugar transferase [Flammeovirgaceae bacterium]